MAGHIEGAERDARPATPGSSQETQAQAYGRVFRLRLRVPPAAFIFSFVV
jgi:hypothetical protein